MGLGFGVIVVNKNGEISVPALSNPSSLPPDPNDPVIGAYQSNDDTAICRLYGNGTYIFMSLIHPSLSFGNWSNNGNNHYSLYIYLTESEGKITYANTLPFNIAQGYDLINGELASSDSSDRMRKISGNPDEVVQVHAYPSTSPETPINRQVGVEVKRVNPTSIYVKVMTGKDVASLVSIRVMTCGEDAQLTSGKISPQIGSIAYYNVNDNADIVVVAEFYDYTHYNIWAGKI
jgi:hypothetical protein